MFVVSICIFWLLFVLHFFHFFIHIFRLSNCEDKAFYNWILSNNGSVHNFYLRKVFLKLWIDLSIIILFKAVKFQDDTPAQDIIFLTADWSNFDLLNTAIIPVKIFVFFFWTILWHLFDRCLLNLIRCCRHARRRSSETKMQRSPVLRCHPYHPCQEFTLIQVAGLLSQSSIHGSFTDEKILQRIKNIS